MVDLSDEAVQRAQNSIKAAPVFADRADLIAKLTPDLPTDTVLVAVVDEAFAFTGTWVVTREEMVARVPELEGPGWAMVFSHNSDADQVRHRATEMASLAAKRVEMIARVRAKEEFRADATATSTDDADALTPRDDPS